MPILQSRLFLKLFAERRVVEINHVGLRGVVSGVPFSGVNLNNQATDRSVEPRNRRCILKILSKEKKKEVSIVG